MSTTMQTSSKLDEEGDGKKVISDEKLCKDRDVGHIEGSKQGDGNGRGDREMGDSKQMGIDGRGRNGVELLKSKKAMGRGVCIMLHNEIRKKGDQTDYGLRFKDAMGTMNEIKGILMMDGRREYEAIYGKPLKERLMGLEGRTQIVNKQKVEWGVERAKEIWDALQNPYNDDWATAGKVADASEIVTQVNVKKKKTL